MQVVVFHKEGTGFKRVAVVDAPTPGYTDAVSEALEYAYQATQNIGGSWSKGDIMIFGQKNFDYDPNVQVIDAPAADEMGKRSTMVGDVMFCNGDKFEVAGIGFKMVSVNEEAA